MAIVLRRDKGSVLTHNEVDDNFVHLDTTTVKLTGNQTIEGVKTFSSLIQGSVSGNSGTVTNGVYTVGNQSIDGVKTFVQNIVGNLTGNVSGNSGTVTDGVYLSSVQTITGAKTFTGNTVFQTGTVTFNGSVTLAGSNTISGGITTSSNNTFNTGTTTINGPFVATSTTTYSGNNTFNTGTTTFNGAVVHAGTTNFTGAITSSGANTFSTATTTFNGPVSVAGTIASSGINTFTGNNTFNTGTVTFNGPVATSNTFTTTGNNTFNTGTTTINGALTVAGAITSTGTNSFTGNNTFSTGTVTFNTLVVGSINGNAATATKLQTIRTINGVNFDGSANITINAVDATDRVASSLLGVANGVATLDATGKVTSSQLPSFVDDVLEYAALVNFPATGETGKIYLALDTNKTYRWSGSVYVYITSGAVDSVAGKTGVVTLVKADVGLGLVDNTADNTKTVLKAITLATARTINGVSFDGSANIVLDTVNLTGDQAVAGVKTFSNGIISNVQGNVVGNVTGDVSGNADTVTNGVYTTGNQTIAGIKTFSDDVVMTPSLSVTPANNGDMMFELTSNTSLTIKVKGSDGVVRSAVLTLA